MMVKTPLRYYFVFALLVSCQLLYPQDMIREKTLSIIDTSSTKLDQAKQIYSWITQHIQYDVEAYLKGNSANQPASSTLKKKKGVCYDYAVLFNEMCASANIESYLVTGYSKGAQLYKGGGFYRADHCWNAIFIDSLWFLADPTWGSGYLVRKPAIIDKLKHQIFHSHYVNKKLAFIQSPSDQYFNPINENWKLTHLPLDPKWQLTQYPQSMNGFELGGIGNEGLFYNYKPQLIDTRNSSPIQQVFAEGINGKAFNVKNNFNISHGYFILASGFDYRSAISDSSNVQLNKNYLTYYNKAKEYISLYQQSVDSIFPARIKTIKTDIKNGKEVGSNVERDVANDRKKYARKKYALSKQHASLEKKIQTYNRKISLLKQSEAYPSSQLKNAKPDSVQQKQVLDRFKKSMEKSMAYQMMIDTLLVTCATKIVSDSVLTSKYIEAKELFKTSVVNFLGPLLTEDNVRISRSWNYIYGNYRYIKNIFKDKSQNLAIIQTKYANMVLCSKLITSEYSVQCELTSRYYKYSLDSIGSAGMYHEAKELLLKAFQKAQEQTVIYHALIGKLISFCMLDFKLNEAVHKPTQEYLEIFAKYEDMLLADQVRAYKVEKGLIKAIGSQSQKAIVAINRKINDASKDK